MSFFEGFGFWDIALMIAVPVHVTVIAYTYRPRWKAFILTLPIPFTTASLALGRQVDATNMIALLFLLAFVHAIRLLHCRFRIPIVAAIAICAAGYCGLASLIAPLVSETWTAFWIATAVVFVLGIILYRYTPHRIEPGHRSPLPIWIKFPIIAAVIAGLIAAKSVLRGFMPLFPMAGVVTVYEARHCLWTISRQIPVILITYVPTMTAIRIAQEFVGLPAALGVGWVVFLATLIPLTRAMWKRDKASAPDESEDAPSGDHA